MRELQVILILGVTAFLLSSAISVVLARFDRGSLSRADQAYLTASLIKLDRVQTGSKDAASLWH